MRSFKSDTTVTKRLLWPAFVLAAMTIVGGCDVQSASVADEPPPEVDVARVLAEPVTLTETFTGRLEAPETVMLRARVSGYIEEVAFEEGEWVEAGDLLFQIDERPYQARVNAARAELAQARSQLQLAESEARRAERLHVGQAISQEEYDQRQAALANTRARVSQAQAALDTAELDLQYTRVIAPVSGRAGRAQVTRGNLASADDTVLTSVVSMDPLYVYFEGDETMAVSSRFPQPGRGKHCMVRVGLSGEEGFPHQGELDYVDNHIDPGTGTLQYRAVIANPDLALRPGQFARVKMPVDSLEAALLVRRKAVLTDQDRRYVYVVDENNAVSQRHVTTGRQVDNLLVIHDGLESGDRVIVNGLHKVLGAGMQVSPRLVAMREDAAPAGTSIAVSGR